MRKVELHCCCGANVTFEDSAQTVILKGGKMDEKGRRFLIDKQSDEWQERHSKCLQERNIRMATSEEVDALAVDPRFLTKTEG